MPASRYLDAMTLINNFLWLYPAGVDLHHGDCVIGMLQQGGNNREEIFSRAWGKTRMMRPLQLNMIMFCADLRPGT